MITGVEISGADAKFVDAMGAMWMNTKSVDRMKEQQQF